MKKAIVATIVFFCAILGVVWYLSEEAHPVMLNVDAGAPRPAQQHQHP